jgi:hypothetical protein
VLTPDYSYLSLTEESEYITSEEEYAQTLESSVSQRSVKLDQAVTAFRERMKTLPAGARLSHADPTGRSFAFIT